MKRILIDLDGVVADFVTGCMEVHNMPYPFTRIKGDVGWNFYRNIWDMSDEVFWEPLDYDFWFNLKVLPYGNALVHYCAELIGINNICFVSSPAKKAGCLEGKRDWVHKHFPDVPMLLSVSAKSSFSTPPKEFCANEHTMLIDDHTPNVTRFKSMGGKGLIYPQPWNDHFSLMGNYQYIEDKIKAFVE